jgi:hypothetical protein
MLMLRPKSPPPRTQIETSNIATDSVEIKLKSNSPSLLFYRWKLDDGEWQQTKEPLLTLSHLPNGEHRFFAIGIDDELKSDPAPVLFTFKTDPAEHTP